MNYLVALYCMRGGSPKVATMVVTLPEDYDFSEDIKLASRTADMDKFKALCYEQCPSGFHDAWNMLMPDNRKYTTVLAISKLC